jgi:hypothetical protein
MTSACRRAGSSFQTRIAGQLRFVAPMLSANAESASRHAARSGHAAAKIAPSAEYEPASGPPGSHGQP